MVVLAPHARPAAALDHTAVEIFNSVAVQLAAIKSGKSVDEPLLGLEVVPSGLAESTFGLPGVDAAVQQFLPVDGSVNKLLGDTSSLPGQQPAMSFHRTEATRRLLVIETTGDGNCLVHAVALALWGQHDRTLASLENTVRTRYRVGKYLD
eukprot:g16093.t1